MIKTDECSKLSPTLLLTAMYLANSIVWGSWNYAINFLTLKEHDSGYYNICQDKLILWIFQ